MSTFLQIINEVLRRTGQIEAVTLLSAAAPVLQAKDFLNETYFEMLQRLKVDRLVKTASISTVSGTASYTLANDAEVNAILPDSLIITATQQRLQEVDYTYPLSHGQSQSASPNVFYRLGNLLYLYPTPNAAITIQYQYSVKPANLANDGDTTAIPVEWEKVLILGTQARLEKFLGEAASDTYLLYRDGLSQLRSRASMKPRRRMKGFYQGSN